MKYEVTVRAGKKITLRECLEAQGATVPEGIRNHLHKVIEELNFNPETHDAVCMIIGEADVNKAECRFSVFSLDKKTALPALRPDTRVEGKRAPAE